MIIRAEQRFVAFQKGPMIGSSKRYLVPVGPHLLGKKCLIFTVFKSLQEFKPSGRGFGGGLCKPVFPGEDGKIFRHQIFSAGNQRRAAGPFRMQLQKTPNLREPGIACRITESQPCQDLFKHGQGRIARNLCNRVPFPLGCKRKGAMVSGCTVLCTQKIAWSDDRDGRSREFWTYFGNRRSGMAGRNGHHPKHPCDGTDNSRDHTGGRSREEPHSHYLFPRF